MNWKNHKEEVKKPFKKTKPELVIYNLKNVKSLEDRHRKYTDTLFFNAAKIFRGKINLIVFNEEKTGGVIFCQEDSMKEMQDKLFELVRNKVEFSKPIKNGKVLKISFKLNK